MKISPIRESHQEAYKAWKYLFSLFPEKNNGGYHYLLSSLMKAALSISLLVSIIFIFLSATQSRWPRCPNCHNAIRTSSLSQEKTCVQIHEENTNISHILFGIGGSAKTWRNRMHYNDLWWRTNLTRGFVWLDEKPPDNFTWPETSPPYRVSQDTLRFKYTNWDGSRSAIRIARIVKESYGLGEENVRWFVMGDDDTVFFTENLVNVLGKYDHNQMYYIGGNSESVEQDLVHSYGMAYGGGGFAISYPLAKELVRLLDGCINRYSAFYGSDEKIGACMAEIGVPATSELGFHQVDIRGNPYGLLAAHPIAELISLHHLDYVSALFPAKNRSDALKLLMSAYELDPARTLQQSFCFDLDRNITVSVSWGYTVQIYPTIVTAKELATLLQTFHTWRRSNGPFKFNTRQVKKPPCEQPNFFFFDYVEEADKGETKSFYNKIGHNPAKGCSSSFLEAMAIRAVNVTSPKMNQSEWVQAPRRQCCKILEPNRNGVLELRIRRCQTGESLTPH